MKADVDNADREKERTNEQMDDEGDDDDKGAGGASPCHIPSEGHKPDEKPHQNESRHDSFPFKVSSSYTVIGQPELEGERTINLGSSPDPNGGRSC